MATHAAAAREREKTMATNRPARAREYLVPPNTTPDTCPACGASIMWTQTKSGLRVPLSVASIEQDAAGQQRYALKHSADCPNAKQHRRKRKTSKQRVRVRP